MTTKIAAIANLTLQTFQQYSTRHILRLSPPVTGDAIDPPAKGLEHVYDASAPFSSSSSQKQLGQFINSDIFQQLCSSVNLLTLRDVGIDHRWLSNCHAFTAPVAYVHITENEVFSMGMFVLRPGSRIPLHDHPGMYGILRVLHGSLRCRSYTFIDNGSVNNNFNSIIGRQVLYSRGDESLGGSRLQVSNVCTALSCQDTILNSESGAVVVTPFEGNLHELTSVNGPAVFFDILAPPYDHDLGTRECHFYEEVNLPMQSDGNREVVDTRRSTETCSTNVHLTSDNRNHSIMYLMETTQPKDYWCESIEYTGPVVDHS